MTEELKLRVRDPERVENRLEREGELVRHLAAVDTYFDTGSKNVMKLRENDSGDWLVRFRPTEQGFEKVTEQKVEDLEEFKQQRERKHGIKAVLEKDMKFFDWKGYTAIVNRIEDVGDFLIIEAEEKPDRDLIESELDLENPEQIEVAFSDLAQ